MGKGERRGDSSVSFTFRLVPRETVNFEQSPKGKNLSGMIRSYYHIRLQGLREGDEEPRGEDGTRGERET